MMPASSLRDAFRALSSDVEVGPDHPWYVSLLGADPRRDPIHQLAVRIDFEESESVHLLTGFRGNGKSTQLRRLKKELEKQGHVVFLVDLLDWMMMSKPVEITDFLLSVVLALDDARRRGGFGESSFWDRAKEWLSAEVRLEGLDLEASAGGVGLKTSLKSDATFRERLQQHLRGQLTRLVQGARAHVASLVDDIRKARNDPNTKVVLLVDSIEQLRGAGQDALHVQNSAQELFVAQADNLRFPRLHVVYTFPPSLLPLAQNLGRMYSGPVTMWPNVHVRQRDSAPDPVGLALMQQVVDRRIAERASVIPDAHLSTLARASGGDIRDFFRLLRDCLVRLSTGNDGAADEALIQQVIAKLRSELLPLADDDARWLCRIHERHDVALDSIEHIPTLVRFFDNNLIMNYENGSTWYDVHPLVLDEIERLTKLAEGATRPRAGPRT